MFNRLCFPYDDENTIQLFEKIKLILDLMEDKTSKEIFINRILYSMTNEQSYMKKIIMTTETGVELEKKLSQAKGVFCYGAGIRGTRFVAMFPNIRWRAFVDQKVVGGHSSGLGIINLEELRKTYQEDDLIVISNLNDDEIIKNELLSIGIKRDKIIGLNEIDKKSGEKIYIDPDFIFHYIDKKTSFVDLGCYDGKDAINFKNAIHDYAAEIYAFEPNPSNYTKCKQALSSYQNSFVYNLGVGDKATSLYMSGGGEMAHISEQENSIKIVVDKLDNILKSKNVGFIKMDVEGFELAAIKGAKSIIAEQKPIIAASVYHKMSDIVNIPELLLQYNSNYKFYMRHYSVSSADTVLYAV